MDHHVVRLAVNVLFAGTVKVKLGKLITLVSHYQKAPASRCVVVHTDRVAAVNNPERAAFVFESYDGEFGFLRTSNVDGRLFLSGFAGSVLRIEITPVVGPVCSFVAPLV